MRLQTLSVRRDAPLSVYPMNRLVLELEKSDGSSVTVNVAAYEFSTLEGFRWGSYMPEGRMGTRNFSIRPMMGR